MQVWRRLHAGLRDRPRSAPRAAMFGAGSRHDRPGVTFEAKEHQAIPLGAGDLAGDR